jgi:hypothetical protein
MSGSSSWAEHHVVRPKAHVLGVDGISPGDGLLHTRADRLQIGRQVLRTRSLLNGLGRSWSASLIEVEWTRGCLLLSFCPSTAGSGGGAVRIPGLGRHRPREPLPITAASDAYETLRSISRDSRSNFADVCTSRIHSGDVGGCSSESLWNRVHTAEAVRQEHRELREHGSRSRGTRSDDRAPRCWPRCQDVGRHP